jgi:uncharacterized protein
MGDTYNRRVLYVSPIPRGERSGEAPLATARVLWRVLEVWRVLEERLRLALREAMQARDRAAIAALRSALAAIGNAEAVEVPEVSARGGAIEASPAGLGAAEVSRRTLAEADVHRIVVAEIVERAEAARGYDDNGQPEGAAQLRAEAAVLRALTEDL